MYLETLDIINRSISLIQRGKEISKNIESAEFKNILADLQSAMADLKIEIASLKEENMHLLEENKELKANRKKAKECPKCGKPAFMLIKTERHPWGKAGILNRIYECSECDHLEAHMVDPMAPQFDAK